MCPCARAHVRGLHHSRTAHAFSRAHASHVWHCEGVDSLAATELSARLRGVGGVSLSSTLVFEQPTPRAICSHLLEQFSGPAPDALAPACSMFGSEAHRAVELSKLVGRWPGGDGSASSTCWAMQRACGNAVGQVCSGCLRSGRLRTESSDGPWRISCIVCLVHIHTAPASTIAHLRHNHTTPSSATPHLRQPYRTCATARPHLRQ